MDILRSITGMVSVEILSADIPGLLSAMAELGIQVFGANTKGELTLEVKIPRRDWECLADLCRRRGEKASITARSGLYWLLKNLVHRPVLGIGMVLLLWMTLLLPGRVLFVRVEGNQQIPTAQILEAAADSGIRFGASRRDVRSEQMKNSLLEALPRLRWAGVNTYGCLAVISVRERAEEQSVPNVEYGIGSIVAGIEGIILSATADRGTCLCQPGQAVGKDQVLISGYSDFGLTIRGTQAKGEVFAQTRRKICAVTPLEVTVRGEELRKDVKYSFLIGKKRINLWKGSGICEGSCDRMYEEYYITLPGGFQLPIALIKETITSAQLQFASLEPDSICGRLAQFSEAYLLREMVSGTIVRSNNRFSRENGLLVLNGEYLCTEMIGRFRQEKNGE